MKCATIMGGRAAEKWFGTISTGALSDLEILKTKQEL
jgi:ATP-dependent Zn protease